MVVAFNLFEKTIAINFKDTFAQHGWLDTKIFASSKDIPYSLNTALIVSVIVAPAAYFSAINSVEFIIYLVRLQTLGQDNSAMAEVLLAEHISLLLQRHERPQLAVDSTGGCNRLMKSFGRCFVV